MSRAKDGDGRHLLDLSDGTRERLYTINEAASRLNIDPRKLVNAVRTGAVRSYTSLAPYPLLRLADVLAAIDPSPEGGWR